VTDGREDRDGHEVREGRDGPSGDPLDTSLLFDVFALNQAVGRLLAGAMRDGPLTPAEYAVYSAIFELESATPTALAARLGMRLTTCIDQLRLLEDRGHARRLPHPRDGRSYLVALTANGLEAHRAANRRFEAAYAAFTASLQGGEPAAKRAIALIRNAADAALARESISPRRPAGRAG
jgi:DNA-binding MarR family transcriptional regulator